MSKIRKNDWGLKRFNHIASGIKSSPTKLGPAKKLGDIHSEEAEILQEDRSDTKLPMYAAVLHNDDYTTMEFVIEVLRVFFGKEEADAQRIMLAVHQRGRGVAGVYSHEIAETKAEQVHSLARTRGFPLLCTVEEAQS